MQRGRGAGNVAKLEQEQVSNREEIASAKGLRDVLEETSRKLGEEIAIRKSADEALKKAEQDFEETRAKLQNANALIDRRKEETMKIEERVETLLNKGRVRTAIIERQEEELNAREEKIAQLERELRRAQNRVALLEDEKEGLADRLAKAHSKLEENATLRANDQHIITYLNKELNEKAITGGTRPTPKFGRRRRQSENSNGYKPSSSSDAGSLRRFSDSQDLTHGSNEQQTQSGREAPVVS